MRRMRRRKLGVLILYDTTEPVVGSWRGLLSQCYTSCFLERAGFLDQRNHLVMCG